MGWGALNQRRPQGSLLDSLPLNLVQHCPSPELLERVRKSETLVDSGFRMHIRC